MDLDGSVSDASAQMLGTPVGPVTVAHPLVAAYPLVEVMREIVADVGGEGGPAAIVHAAQETRFLRPIPLPATVVARASLAASGAYGLGTGHLIEFEIVDVEGVALCCGTTTVATTEPASGPPLVVGRHPSGRVGPAAVAERRVERGDVARYAALSGDNNPMHLSEDAARAVGLPTVAMHGMHLLALFATEVVDLYADGDPTRIAAVRARFSRVVHPPADLRFEVFQTTVPGRITGAVTCGGRRVLRDAVMELRPYGERSSTPPITEKGRSA